MKRILLAIAIAGALGGLLNAALGNGGLIMPKFVSTGGDRVVVPGFVGNVLVGAFAAFISFGLYGPLSGLVVFRSGAPAGDNPAADGPAIKLTVAALAGALLVGYSGGRWLTAEADRQLNRAALEATADNAADAVAQSATATATARPNLIKGFRDIKSASPVESYLRAMQMRETLDRKAP